MLGGRDEDALAHEAGGVTHAGDIAPTGGDGEVVEVSANEDDASRRRRWKNADLYGNPVVEADAGYLDGFWMVVSKRKDDSLLSADGRAAVPAGAVEGCVTDSL